MGLLLCITDCSQRSCGCSILIPTLQTGKLGLRVVVCLTSRTPVFKGKHLQDTPSSRTHTNWGRARSQWFYLRGSRSTDSQLWKESAWIWSPLSLRSPLPPHTPGRFSPHCGDPHLQQSPKLLKVDPCSTIEGTSVSIKKSSRSPYWRQISMATAKHGLVLRTRNVFTHCSTPSRTAAS